VLSLVYHLFTYALGASTNHKYTHLAKSMLLRRESCCEIF
jgi:hypothetical protein